MTRGTREMYDAAAGGWRRDEAVILSDFTARERVIETMAGISGLHLWDLGCGEGYVGRQLARFGPRRIDGFDLSAAMVESAQLQAGDLGAAQGGPLHYAVADLSDAAQFPQGQCDAAVAVFLFNYLSLDASLTVLRQIHAAVRPGGFFLFTVPHPALAFLGSQQPPFWLDPAGHTYLHSSDACFEGMIWRRDGSANPVRSRHKTLGDYFELFAQSGWSSLPQLEELGVTDAHLALDPEFFTPLRGVPLHILFRLQR